MTINSIIQYACRGILAIIIWILWKRRKKIKHGGQVQLESLIQQVIDTSNILIRIKYPEVGIKGKSWIEMLGILSGFKPKIYHYLVYCGPPEEVTI